jgi:tetraacyldisaccharide 4'-kinase
VPVVVGENRYEAARVATAELGAASIVLDDGFQNLTLAKDLDVLVVNGRAPWGNGRLFPRGPLREPVAAARRAHLVVVTNPPRPGIVREVSAILARHGATAAVLSASYRVVGARRAQDAAWREPEALRGLRLFAFAGLGSPEGFADTLRATGIVMAGFVEFPDHHWYESADLGEVVRRARAAGAEGLITTEKDGTRLRHLALPSMPLWTLSVSVSLPADEPRFLDAIRAVAARHPVPPRP